MFQGIKNLIHRATAPAGRPSLTRGEAAREEARDWTMRRYEAAETNRLNIAQWGRVKDVALNTDLNHDLTFLRSRATWEAARNPAVEGVINTFCTDLVGKVGPDLQVISDDDADDDWCKAQEAVWDDWFEHPEISGRMGGVDWLKLCVRQLWLSGEFLAQKVTRQINPGPVAMRLKAVSPRRLYTPPQHSGEADVVMGIRQTYDGEPIEYFISDPLQFGAFFIDLGKFTAVPAAFMIHRFLVIEEDQSRGVPWLATPLQACADARDYDAQVLDAARQAADWAISLYTEHPDAEYVEVNEVADVERRRFQTMPPGWKPMGLQPPQPATNYIDYRGERQADIGRPVNMPKMMVRLDSSDHNYSSARFDDSIYRDGIGAVQGWTERRTLNPLVDDVRRESMLFAASNRRWKYALLSQPPMGRVTYNWIWPKRREVDPQKERTGERIGMENGTLAYADACASAGTTEDRQILKLKRTLKKFEDAGVPVPPAITGQSAMPGQQLADQQAAQDAADAAEESTKKKGGAKPAAQPAPAKPSEPQN